MDGNFIDRGVQDGGHNEIGGSILYGTPYILYQLILPELLLDCFCMSFQSGVVFCNSQEIGGFPCQDTTNWVLELEFRVYHSI